MKRVFIAGAARTGSMWTFNVTKALLEIHGFQLLPNEPTKLRLDEKGLADNAYRVPIGANQVYFAKLHQKLKIGLPETKIITNYRDVRESTLSYIKFMKFRYTADNLIKLAKEVAKVQMNMTDYYFDKHKDNLRIKFNHIASEPVRVLDEINSYLGLTVGHAEMAEIADRFSKKKVKQLINGLNSVPVNEQGSIGNKDKSGSYSTVRNPDGSYRVYDNRTGFQTDHITSDKSGGWREYFTPEQQEELNDFVSDWLVKYGFPV